MKITLGRLGTIDLATLANRTIEASENGKYTMVHQHPLLEILKAEYADYQKVYTKLHSSGMGRTIEAADAERDSLFGEVRNYLEGVAGLRRAPGKEAAGALLKVFEHYGKGLSKMSYSTESGRLKNLLLDLEQPENQAHVKTLKLESYIAELQTLQQQFEELFGQQSEANAELRELPAATAVRRELELALRNYFDLLEAMKSVPEWKMLHLDISEMVSAAALSHQTEAPPQKGATPKQGPSSLGFRP